MTAELPHSVATFLRSYGEAFFAYDIDRIVTHFALPCHFTYAADPVTSVAITSAKECAAAIKPILRWHMALNVADGAVTRATALELAPTLTSFEMTYELRDKSGARLYDYDGVYTLLGSEGSAQITSIAHNQIPRLFACLRANGITP